MSEDKHTPLPWKAINLGTTIVDEANHTLIADVWAQGENRGGLVGRANAALIVRSVNSLPALVKALEDVQKIIAEGAMTGFNWKDGDWADRLFKSQQATSAALAAYRSKP